MRCQRTEERFWDQRSMVRDSRLGVKGGRSMVRYHVKAQRSKVKSKKGERLCLKGENIIVVKGLRKIFLDLRSMVRGQMPED